MKKREARELVKIAREKGLTIRVDTHSPGYAYFDGGEYGFWVEYVPCPKRGWRRIYRTTADFPYCGRVGEFRECNHENDWTLVSMREVMKDLRDAEFVGITDEKIYCDATHRRSRK